MSWRDKKSVAAPRAANDGSPPSTMRYTTWIRVVLGLVCLGVPARAAQPFTPLAVPIALPESLRGKAVWALHQLPDGRLAVGCEGSIAIGVPGGNWTIIATPNGGPVQAIAAAHGRVLVAGGGFAGFVESGEFVPAPGLMTQITEAQAVPEGWLLSGPAGLWLVPPAGAARQLAPGGCASDQPTLGRWGNAVVVLSPEQPPRLWSAGALGPAHPGLPTLPAQARFLRDRLWFTDAGVFGQEPEPVLPATVANTIMDDAGLIGAADGRPWLLCATYWQGLLAYGVDALEPAWRWSGLGTCYSFTRMDDSLLVGTTLGAFGLADPNRVRIARLDNAEILHLQAEPGGARLVTLHGVVAVGDLADNAPPQLWPAEEGAVVSGGDLHFGGQVLSLPTRFLNGLSVCGDTVAAAYSNVVLVAGPATPVACEFTSGLTSLATDGHAFFAGTHADGIQVIGRDGQRREKIGTGRAKVREIAPHQLRLLFWNGEVRDDQNSRLGRVPVGNPRDAALVDVKLPDGTVSAHRLAVLATRAGVAPLVGWLEGETWRPLDLPGLAEIDAETLASAGGRLYVAGRHGVLEFRMPLPPAVAPAVAWSWDGGGDGPYLALAAEQNDQAVLVPGRWAAPPAAATVYRVRHPNGLWTEAHAGVALPVAANWGRNTVVLQSERNGLVSQRELVVVRPYPWSLRPWALALEAAAIAAAVWVLGRWRTRHLLRQKRELEAAVEQRTAQLRKANAAKEEFLASISHEIRNPLNGVVGICAILQDSEVGPREKNFVQVLSGCAEQLHSMLDDVLDFSRIDRGEITLTTGPFEIRALVEESARVMDPLLEACTLQLPETSQWLAGDSGKIRQIVCNLVANALKYGRPREAGVELRLTPEAGRQTRVRLAVHNTGPTISPEELPRLFESFRRGAGAANTPGFGLGLAVCRRLAERMGGRMTAASADGRTEFALELVLPQAEPTTASDAHTPTVSRALAIEDEDYNRLALGHVLRSLGYEIDWAPDGASALQLARRQQYDLILTDWRLPDIEGDELSRQLQAVLVPPRPPIVAVTAYSSSEKMDAARAAGMAGFVTKPVTREKLEQLIRNLDTGLSPRRSLDLTRMPAANPALALLGELAPTMERLGADLANGWQQTEAQARLHDPRSGRSAHALRSLLLLAGEADLAEQFGLLEAAAGAGDWVTAEQLLPFLGEELVAARTRLSRS